MDDLGFEETCTTCDGSGTVITCLDDLCHALGHCIHGDGEEPCTDCGGEGEYYDPDDTAALVEKRQ